MKAIILTIALIVFGAWSPPNEEEVDKLFDVAERQFNAEMYEQAYVKFALCESKYKELGVWNYEMICIVVQASCRLQLGDSEGCYEHLARMKYEIPSSDWNFFIAAMYQDMQYPVMAIRFLKLAKKYKKKGQ